jgi:hypothetical protein
MARMLPLLAEVSSAKHRWRRSERNRFAVSERLRADFDNGVHYYAMQGTDIAAPSTDRPAGTRSAQVAPGEPLFGGGGPRH